jgi:type I restriction enzyme S subunit
MWTVHTLGEICDEVGGVIQTGPFGSQLHESDYVGDGVPVVMPKNILDGKIDRSDIAFISEEEAARLQRHRMSIGDIVYGRRGDIGRRGLIGTRENGWLCGTGCLRVSLGNTIIDPKYLYYYLGQPLVVAWIANQAVGATMPNLNTGILRSVKVRYPRPPVQRRIASILSAYDDLIDNNTRRIKILEEMAQMLYREWFVHFRFPGHEKVRMVE